MFFSTLMVVSHLAIKSFDLVMALTAGGPGFATDLPATFMYAMAFSRGQIGLGAASATVMLALVAAIVVPYLYSELRVSANETASACTACCCWAALLLFAAWFLTPLYVMVATSLKDMEQVRDGNLLSLPADPTLARLGQGLEQACTGIDCGGLRPFFVNSLLMVVPAVLVSTAIGALNGYVLTKWRFRGSETDVRDAAVRRLHADAGGAAADEPGAGLARHRRARSGA